jgi:cytochrome c oxidase subunit III
MSEGAILKEPWRDLARQREGATFGIWIFLASELLFFGSLLLLYTVYRVENPQAFAAAAARETDIFYGTVNTAVLLTSSLTMALAIHAAAANRTLRSYYLLLLTAVIGVAFIAIKFTEYYQHYEMHKVPGIRFESTSPQAGAMQLFYIFYFIMTGLHAIHMSIGIVLVVLFAFRTAVGQFNQEYHTPLEALGLYWHFVDIVWIYLFAIFYISGLHK